MFRYFPTNHALNLSVDLAVEMGARMGGIETMCAPLQQAAKAPSAAGTQALRETWVAMADRPSPVPLRVGAEGHANLARQDHDTPSAPETTP